MLCRLNKRCHTVFNGENAERMRFTEASIIYWPWRTARSKQGNLRQAMEMYWMLLKGHSGTSQSLEAQESLPKLAKSYERDDGRHTARAVYERILCSRSRSLIRSNIRGDDLVAPQQ